MAWPDAGKYIVEIQNPHKCFIDAELKAGKVVTNHLGLPKPASGNFAVVFKIDGAKKYAVKCFTQEVSDQHQRYASITRHLSGKSLEGLVEFKYLEKGIQVGGHYYPIVKMEWVAGQLLPLYIEQYVQAASDLRRVAAEWQQVIEELRRSGIAHGDLQNGNIKVVAGKIRLVDYDGMYVSALRGKPPNEIGHRHFQHPGRTQQDYGEHLDNFAALVIYLSLLAVAQEPKLWQDFHNNDHEKLILSEADFTAPGRTEIWRRLKASANQEVRQLTQILEEACRGPVSRVPNLETAITGLVQPQTMSPTMSAADWRNLAGAFGSPSTTSPISATPASASSTLPTHPTSRIPPSVACTAGHIISNPSFYRYCPECARQGRKNAIYGYRIAPCGHRIPERSPFCPDCGKSTGW